MSGFAGLSYQWRERRRAIWAFVGFLDKAAPCLVVGGTAGSSRFPLLILRESSSQLHNKKRLRDLIDLRENIAHRAGENQAPCVGGPQK
jgi:hypothetical protein